MSSFEKITTPLIYVFRHQKKVILAAIVAMFVFAVLLFPYDDLADKVTDLISKSSQNQVFLQFDELGLGFFPPALKLSKVVLEAQFLPGTLKASHGTLAPSIAGLLAFKPGFSVSIEDVMKGDVHLTYRAGKKINDSTQLQKVDLTLSKIDLKSLAQFASLPLIPNGQLSADFNADFDTNFAEQPEADLQLQIGKFSLPASTIATVLGPLGLPATALSKIQLKGSLKGGELVIDDGVLGTPGETINGRFKGRIAMRLVRYGSQLQPEFGGYEFKVDLNLDRTSEKNLALFLSFIDKYKTITGTGSRYALKISAPNMQVPPTPGPLGSF